MANGNNKKHAAKPLSPLEWAAGAVPILGQTYVAGRLAKEAYKKAARGESKIANYSHTTRRESGLVAGD